MDRGNIYKEARYEINVQKEFKDIMGGKAQFTTGLLQERMVDGSV